MNKFLNRFALVGGLSGLAVSAHAAIPQGVSDAIADMQADGVEMAGLVLVAIIAVAAVLFLKKAIGR